MFPKIIQKSFESQYFEDFTQFCYKLYKISHFGWSDWVLGEVPGRFSVGSGGFYEVLEVLRKFGIVLCDLKRI